MKHLTLTTVIVLVATVSTLDVPCTNQELDIPTDWIDMNRLCVQKMRTQVTEELKASMQYMAMGAFFSKDTLNRPGFAQLFFKAASEERQHAINLISYLLMRGGLTVDASSLIKRNLVPAKTSWPNGISALKDALKLQAMVTRRIRSIIEVCESGTTFNDYHLNDYLIGEFLEEQYHGQRDIAGKTSSLEKMMKQHGDLGEWLFDKKLLNGEI